MHQNSRPGLSPWQRWKQRVVTGGCDLANWFRGVAEISVAELLPLLPRLRESRQQRTAPGDAAGSGQPADSEPARSGQPAETGASAGDADRVVLVDVREEWERRVSVIPGAISAVEFERRLAPRLAGEELAADAASSRSNATPVAASPHSPPVPQVVVYCTAGFRSGGYVRRLNRQGISAVNLRGGIFAWCQAGQPVVTPAGAPTKRVHIHARPWNLLPPGYEPVWRSTG